jgi:4-amino-4-deoxy-L-arabinose transferase-like glycosyltransferase
MGMSFSQMFKRPAFVLLLIILVFLFHFFLRAHRPTNLPLFIDEDRHLRRAAAIEDLWTLGQNSHGKYLLYIWLAPFNTERSEALYASRVAVALFSLIGLAALYALTRWFFGQRAAFIAILFYALAPYALFYERMALADPLAGTVAAVAAWQSVVFARRPTRRHAILIGVLVGLSALAKLTMVFIAVLPVLAALLFGARGSPAWAEMPDKLAWLRRKLRLYFPLLVMAGLVSLLVWLPVLIPVGAAIVQGEKYVLVDRYLAGDNLLKERNFDKLVGAWNTFPMLLSPLMVLGIVIALLLAVWRFPKKSAYILGWLALAYLPTILLVGWVQTRYFMPGIFPLAMLFGAGIVALADVRLPRLPSLSPRTRARLALAIGSGVLGVWAVLFALPFANHAAYDAPQIELPTRDERQYYQTRYSAYGLLDAMRYLQKNGHRAGREVEVYGIMFMCRSMDLYPFAGVDLKCLRDEYPGAESDPTWDELTKQAHKIQPLYLIIEDYRDVPAQTAELDWERLRAIQRPKDGVWVTVWQVCPADDQTNDCPSAVSQSRQTPGEGGQ